MYICHKFKIMSDKVTAYSPPNLEGHIKIIIRPPGGGGFVRIRKRGIQGRIQESAGQRHYSLKI